MAQAEGYAPMAGEAILRAIKAAGIDHVLANPGTDFPSLIEALADPALARALPVPLAVHHESVAMGMAHGHYLVSGRMLAVMVHVNVGLANCAMGALNAAASQVPVLMVSGRTPVTETGRPGSRVSPIHWGQEMFDQAGLVREAVKWDYELRFPEQAASVVARAVSVARSAPCGPVYLSLPREVLAERVTLEPPVPGAGPADPPPPDPGLIDRAAALLAGARAPLIVVQRSAPAGHLDALARLAEAAAIPVVEFWATAGALPNTHPMHAGFDPAPLIGEADVVLGIGASVPWVPSLAGPVAPKVIALGPDPLDLGTPYRGFAADIALTGDAGRGVAALADALEGRVPGEVLAARQAAQAARRAAQAEAVEAQIAAGAKGPMTAAYVSRVLSEEAGPEAAIFAELASLGAALRLERAGQLFWTPHSGGLGWGLPAALGAKLAQPERTVIATVGDGSYLFANPAACHQVSAAHGLPVLTVVFNNGLWNAVRRATLGMYPKGHAAAANEMPLTGLGPSPDYAAMAAAHGAHAVRVADPGALRAEVARALQVVRSEGRQALIEVAVA